MAADTLSGLDALEIAGRDKGSSTGRRIWAATWPKLVVSGGHSRIFDLVCDVLQRQLPVRREVFRGAGHSIPRLGAPVNECLARLWASSVN